jgi:homoserine O-succinyltransferase/O-acetyltransferase
MLQRAYGEPLVIGVVNNMPDPALKSTERQFKELLNVASGDLAIRVQLYSLPEVPRAQAVSAYIAESYEDFGDLWTSRLDGLIVTGTEPVEARLPQEPYWRSLTALVDWADKHSIATVWSCLAAHAAVYHLDKIDRQRFPDKLTGVFDCARIAAHQIVTDTPGHWCMPHSRCNDLPESALVAAGYQILSRSPAAGADMFIKQRDGLFIFLQGHPEYDPDSLLREYQRDVGRFLRGERDLYPLMPQGYFDSDGASAIEGFRVRATAQRTIDLLSEFPRIQMLHATARHWRTTAVRIYANWLALLLQSRRPTRTHSA